MSKYTGKSVTIPRPIGEIYAKVSDLSQYRELVEQVPAEQRSKLQGIEFGPDSVEMDAPSIGRMKFMISERVAPNRVVFSAQGAPVPLKISVDLKEEGSDKTAITPAIDIEIPAMLRPFIGGKLQEAADQFGSLFTTIFK